MRKAILVTGSSGYLGGRLVQYLARDPQNKLRTLAHTPIPQAEDNISSVETIIGDICEQKDVESACNNIDCIIHLAALNEIECAEQPEKAILVNVLGTMRLLEAARMNGVQRFIYFSTAHVYGAPLEGRLSELSVPHPVHPYAISHRSAEDIVLSAHFQKHLTGIVLRLSNALGSPVHTKIKRWTLISNDLCRQAIQQHKLVLKSSGLQRRDFVALSDVERAVEHFIKLPVNECGDGLFNLGGNCALRIIDLANIIADRCEFLFGFRPELVLGSTGEKESESILDYQIEKMKSSGFYPQGDLKSEIDNTLNFCAREFGKSYG